MTGSTSPPRRPLQLPRGCTWFVRTLDARREPPGPTGLWHPAGRRRRSPVERAKQLIAIARALAGQPKTLFLDEATSHIDSETEQAVQRALNGLRGCVTMVAVAHRLLTIRDADRIVVLNHGRIAEAGMHEELMEIDGGIYQRLYLLQQIDQSATFS